MWQRLLLWGLLTCALVLAEGAHSLRGKRKSSVLPVHRKLILTQDDFKQGGSVSEDSISGMQWMISFRKNADPTSKLNLLRKRIGSGDVIYSYQLSNAIAVKALTAEVLQSLLDDDDVLYIEQDQPVYLYETQSLEDGQPWGLDRIDQVGPSLNEKYSYEWTGAGVDVFIFDTGIQSDHDEFEGRVECGLNLVLDEDCNDGQGHGTHVAGIVGGKTYGVAKGVNLITVKALNKNGGGSVAKVIVGLEYVTLRKKFHPERPMIINLSLGSNVSLLFNEAIDHAASVGVVVVTAAGNTGIDACTTSPGSSETAIKVAGSDNNDSIPDWSNYGPCINLHGPSTDILSAKAADKDQTATGVKTGSSMAAPHVAGVAAMYLQWDPRTRPEDVLHYMEHDSLQDILTDARPSTPNRLINSVAVNSLSKSTTKDPTLVPTMTPTVLHTPVPTKAPTTKGTVNAAASMAPTFPPSEVPRNIVLGDIEGCGASIFRTCSVDADCCTNACTNFGSFLGLGKRCFFF